MAYDRISLALLLTMKNFSFSISIIFLFFIHLFHAFSFPLSAEEAYYWMWSTHLDWGYWDHPPMVAYGSAIGTWFFSKSVIGVRILGILLHILGCALLSSATRQKTICFLLLTSLPYWSAEGFVLHPTLYFHAFWCMTLWGLHQKKTYWTALFVVGLLLSKTIAWLILPVFLCTALFHPTLRKEIHFPCIFLACALLLPYFLWHMKLEWIVLDAQRTSLYTSSLSIIAFLNASLEIGLLAPLLLMLPFLYPKEPQEWWIYACSLASLPLLFFPEEPMLITTCGLIFLMVQRSPSKSTVLLGVQLFPFVFWTIQQHYPLLHMPKPPYHKFDGGKIIADVMIAWDINNIWAQDPYDAAWIRFYSPYPAHSSPRFGWDSQFNLWPKDLGQKGIFVQRTEEALPVTSDYKLYNQQPVSSYVPGYTEGEYTQTHSWRTLLFEKKD